MKPVAAALVAAMLLLSLATTVQAHADTYSETEPAPATPIQDTYLEEYLPCTNARYRAWYGAS
jgi:hypothetical protein